MSESSSKIAIVGFSGQFPNSQNVEELWSNIFSDKDCLTEYTRDQIDKYHQDLGLVDFKNYRFVVGEPQGMKEFDAAFFGINPQEATFMDPQHRKFLEISYQALEHAGYNPLQMREQVGVFASQGVSTYLLSNIIDSGLWDERYQETAIYGCGYDYLATRVSYMLNLTGPSYTVQSGCSGSLLAVHLAVQSLLSYECDAALAGGVSILTPTDAGYLYKENGILSESGRCKSFDDNADGTIFTNGYGAVVLKRLDDAIADGNKIYATIISSSINNDGNKKMSYAAPSATGQKSAIRSALLFSGICPSTIGYIECHGTGTKIGDPIEVEALSSVYSNESQGNVINTVLGSVKSNIGHLNSAAGIAGLLKVVGSLLHHKKPGTVHFKKLNKQLEGMPFRVLTKTEEWKASKEPRRAALSSFGVGGTNVHLILEEYKELKNNDNAKNVEFLFLLSAKTHKSLVNIIEKWKYFLNNQKELNLAAIFYTLAVGRPAFEYRYCIKIKNKQELYAALTRPEIIKANLTNEQYKAKKHNLDDIKKAFLEGKEVDWEDYFTKNKRTSLPVYEFEKEKYWLDINLDHKSSISFRNHKNPDMSKWFYTLEYVERDRKDTDRDENQSKIIWIIESKEDISSYLRSTENLCKVITLNISQFKNKDEYLSLLKSCLPQQLPDVIVHAGLLNVFNFDDENAIKYGLFNIMHLIQALTSYKSDFKTKISIITKNLTNITPNEPIEPLKATIFGISRTLNKEYDHECCVIDIDSVHVKNYKLSKDIIYGDEEFIVYRGWQRFVESYRNVSLTPNLNNLEQGTYIITGGIGYFGLEIAHLISKNCPGSKFVLISRSSLPNKDDWDQMIQKLGDNHGLTKKIQKIKLIEKNLCNVVIEQGNVADYEFMSFICKKHATNNAIKGVVHAAGVVESSILDRKTEESFNSLFDAKVWGSINIVKILANISQPNFVILCSSMNSMIGGLGQADNTASTAFVDHFARYCRSQGMENVFALNWGAVNQSKKREFESLPEFRGLSEEHLKNRMTDEETKAAFLKILLSGSKWPRVVVSTIDLNTVLKEWNNVSTKRSLTREVQVPLKKRDSIEIIKNNDFIYPVDLFEEKISYYLSEILGIDKVSMDDNFFDLGGHSLSAIRLNEKIKKDFGISLHAMTIYEYPIVKEMAQFIREKVQSKQSVS